MKKKYVNNIIEELSEVFKNQYKDFYGIYLFGSYLHGGANEDSDLDLAVVFDREIDWKFKREIRRIAYRIESKYDILIDLKLFSQLDLKVPLTPFRYNIVKEGKYYGY